MTGVPKIVEVVEYDPAWPKRFQVLARRAAEALGEIAISVEHVGSTSVPGLAAKPVIDLAAVVRAVDAPRAIERLAAIGYAHQGDKGIPGREAFRPPPGEEKHHLYVCVPESRGFRDHLVFRDYLRAHPEVAREYAELKRALAARHRHDSEAYQQAKSAFIEAVTRRAEAVIGEQDESRIHRRDAAVRAGGLRVVVAANSFARPGNRNPGKVRDRIQHALRAGAPGQIA